MMRPWRPLPELAADFVDSLKVSLKPSTCSQYRSNLFTFHDWLADQKLTVTELDRAQVSRWLGHLVKCETSILVDGRKRFRGKIVASDENGFTLERDQPAYGEEPSVVIPFTALAEGKLILTDDLIRDALTADKKAKAAQAANQNDEDADDE